MRVPELGVPRAPPLVMNEPAVPTFTPSAVDTPVPKPVRPDSGKPVALVRVRLDGVPRFGVTRVGEVPNTRAPEPVLSVTMVSSSLEVSIEAVVSEPDAHDCHSKVPPVVS